MERIITISKEDLDEINEAESYDKLKVIERELRIKNPSLGGDCGKEGSFPFIPMSMDFVVKRFIALRKWIKTQDEYPIKTENNKFLDAGSGIGNILFLAKATKLTKHFTGIEFSEPTHKMAEKLIDNKEGDFKLILDNILTYNEYNNFDIIYYYCPLVNQKLEVYFEELIEDTAAIGTIILPMMKMGHQADRDSRLKKITLAIKCHGGDENIAVTFYVKIKNGKRRKSCLPSIKRSTQCNGVSKYKGVDSDSVIKELQKDRAEIY